MNVGLDLRAFQMQSLLYQTSTHYITKAEGAGPFPSDSETQLPSVCPQVVGDSFPRLEDLALVKLSAVQIKNSSNFLLEFLCD